MASICLLTTDAVAPYAANTDAYRTHFESLGHTVAVLDIATVTDVSTYNAFDMIWCAEDADFNGVGNFSELIDCAKPVVVSRGPAGGRYALDMFHGGTAPSTASTDLDTAEPDHGIALVAGWFSGNQGKSIPAISIPASDLAGGMRIVAERGVTTEMAVGAAATGGLRFTSGAFAGPRIFCCCAAFSSTADQNEIVNAILRAYLPPEGGVYNVKTYGARGNGITNDTAVVQHILTLIPATGAVVFFPPGTYSLSLNDTSGKSYTIIGGGSGRAGSGTIPDAAASAFVGVPGTAYMWRIDNTVQQYGQRITFRDVGFNGGSIAFGMDGLSLIGPGNPISTLILDDVSFRECVRGVSGLLIARIYGCSFNNCTYGIDMEPFESGELSVVACRFNSSGLAHIRMTNVYNLILENSYLLGSGQDSIICEEVTGRIQIAGNFFTNAERHHVFINNGFYVTVVGNIFELGGLTGGSTIRLQYDGFTPELFTIADNIIGHTNGTIIYINGTGAESIFNGIIHDNLVAYDVVNVTTPGNGIDVVNGGGVLIHDNVVHGGTGPGRGTPAMVRGINMSNGTTPNQVRGNRIISTTGDRILATNVPVIVGDNQDLGDYLTPGALTATNNNNYAVSAARSVRITGHANGTSVITGVANPCPGRQVRFINVGTPNVTISHQNLNSDEANRILHPAGANVVLAQNDILDLEYDPNTARWRVVNVMNHPEFIEDWC